MDIRRSNGVNYFDANMNPGINTKQAVEALDMYKSIIEFLDQAVSRWTLIRLFSVGNLEQT